ncbi:contact-dependent growth inhibition system immunity protein [Streptomyces sp. NPDC057382]|uniref:contact-dependent growth inhibition system immunity protein n=1 Tax=unclassified Streptomyces TaxID=2593676 RepID=UPI00364532F2
MKRLPNRASSLEALEGHQWPTPPPHATRLVATTHALRRRPIGELTVENLRLLIGQNVGLRHLLPLALEVLRDNPMAEGDLYEGDLLSAVLTRDQVVWTDFPDLGDDLRVLVGALTALPPDLRKQAEMFLSS